MTREELEKEADKYADTVKCEWENDTYWVDCRDEVTDAYLAGAEPREKRIEELDKENGKLEGKLADLQSEYVELENFHNNEVNKLKAQLAKAKQLLAFWVNSFYDAFNRSIKYDEKHKVLVETEQFLKEIGE